MPDALGWTRRRLLQSLSSLSLIPLAGCTPRATSVGLTDASPNLIDAHCHLFNVTDLPAATFAQTVLLKDYPAAAGLTFRQRALRNALLRIQWLVSRRVVTAQWEATNFKSSSFAVAAVPLSDAEHRELEREEAQAETARPAPVSDTRTCEPKGGFSPSIRSIREWLQSLRSPRASMARQLTSAHRQSGYAPRLFCPALVDYSNWLRQELQSPLPDQIMMGGKLARDPLLPPIHGYVAFDPLRRALVRNGKTPVDGNWDPLTWTRTALTDQGYLGVKVYPPMGFRPAGNSGSGDTYPAWVIQAFGSADEAGKQLDISLDELWALAEELDAPIMAHGANSNAAGLNYGRRGDPAYWLPVVRNRPTLRVMLAHFGRFGTFSADLPNSQCDDQNDVPFAATWEAAIGRQVRDHPNSLLFADISYFSEIFTASERQRALARMKEYLEFDKGARHLVFGSDWVMLGIEKEYANAYARRVATFLTDCGLSDTEVDGVMYGNALRFLGLTSGAKARERMLSFYSKHGLPPERLPLG